MIQICAWCRQEGKSGILGRLTHTSGEPESHGICPRHLLSLRHAYWQNMLQHNLTASSGNSFQSHS